MYTLSEEGQGLTDVHAYRGGGVVLLTYILTGGGVS